MAPFSTRVTRRLGKLVSTCKARLCLVKLSSTLNTRIRRCAAVTSLAKSIDDSWPGAVNKGLGRSSRFNRLRRVRSPSSQAHDTHAAPSCGSPLSLRVSAAHVIGDSQIVDALVPTPAVARLTMCRYVGFGNGSLISVLPAARRRALAGLKMLPQAPHFCFSFYEPKEFFRITD
jgi:hypothetical protein